MPIPVQNDFLLPFLRFLSDGSRLTRSQLLYQLANHFDISEAEAQQMSGNQFTLVNRLAWCDTHFVKAGFVDKHQHHRDSMEDEFSITSLGIHELNKRPSQLTVGYLQSFYRSKVHRGAGSDDSTSDAELLLYEMFDKLPAPFEVFHSVRWITHTARRDGTVGEADFIIAHPDLGVLVLEVKGGEVFIDKGQWYSRARSGRVNEIKDPCEQAERNRRALTAWLANDTRTRSYRYAIFPAVALPDSQVGSDVRPDCPQDLFIDLTHLSDIEKRIRSIFAFWKRRADAANQKMDGTPAVAALVSLLVPTRQLQPRIADVFERERRKIDELTQNQFRILRLLQRHRRATIIGGAGTGKTMLAMEKAQQLAQAGFRVLFLCFNKPLADWIGLNLQSESITVSTFHSFVRRALGWMNMKDADGLNWEEFNNRAPDLLLDVSNQLRAPKSTQQDKLFDAIIVDEAQDFEDTWWIALPEFLRDQRDGVFYIFFDDNQRIYTQISSVPMETEPFFLDENCRNTQHIHARLQPFAKVQIETICMGPEGRPVEVIPVKDHADAKRQMQSLLHRLVNVNGISPRDIAVLTPVAQWRSLWQTSDNLGNFTFMWTYLDDEVRNTLDSYSGRQTITVSTIHRFKGLERAVIILTELDQVRDEIADQLIYVGLSRARHHVIVIGELPAPIPS